jgi:hypothetical protein
MSASKRMRRSSMVSQAAEPWPKYLRSCACGESSDSWCFPVYVAGTLTVFDRSADLRIFHGDTRRATAANVVTVGLRQQEGPASISSRVQSRLTTWGWLAALHLPWTLLASCRRVLLSQGTPNTTKVLGVARLRLGGEVARLSFPPSFPGIVVVVFCKSMPLVSG